MDRPDGHHVVNPAALLGRCTFAPPGSAVRLGVSGGADSLALLVLATAADLDVTAVHVDHRLRAGSEAEAERVAAAADRFGASFEPHRVDVDDGPNLEARARNARLAVLGPGAATGHTADDQAETVLINLLRGAGVDGLAAMRPGPAKPILGLRRSETHALCAALGLDPVVDPSNDDPRFVRNRIRHELIPLAADIAGRDPVPLLARAAAAARRHVDHLDRLVDAVDPTDSRGLRAAHDLVAIGALRRWVKARRGRPPSVDELERILDVVHLRRAACELAGGWRLARTDGVLRLEADPRR
ncbi:MAG: tRNA lysidine(34) synthetase TilS [Acidimicrobiales bacterium]